MRIRRCTGVLIVLALAVFVQASQLGADDGVPGERDLSRVRKKVEALRAWRLSEELDLDEGTSAKLFPAMRETDEERWRIERRNRELVRELAGRLDGPDPEAGRIDRILDELQANRARMARIEERHIERVRKILSPADTGRYILFQIRFQRELKRRAAEAFREGRGTDPDRGSSDRYRSYDAENDGSGGFGGGDGDRGGGRGGRR